MKTTSRSIRAWTLFSIAASALAGGCHRNSSHDGGSSSKATSSFDADVAVQWLSLLYDVVKSTPLSPPVAARAYAYGGVTLYESVVPGMPSHLSLAGQLNEFTGVPQPSGAVDFRVVANSALAGVIRGGIVPGIQAADVTKVDTLEQQFIDQLEQEVNANVFMRSVDLGDQIAAAILAWAADDGYDIFHNCPYTPPVGPGLWVSLTATPPVEPCWDLLRPFFLTTASECPPGSHPTFDETPGSPFWNEADEVRNTGDAGASLTPEEREIAFFWSDGPTATGTPPGHWISITAQLLEDDQATLDVAAEAFALVGLAVSDAFIACWQAKFQYNLERPITYIQRVIDATWDPLLGTPNFPEYTSGHSTQSGAAARVLTDLFGPRSFTDDTHNLHSNATVLVECPNPRTFADFDAAAFEAAESRLFGGIHFRAAIDFGLSQGTCVGDELLQNVQFLK